MAPVMWARLRQACCPHNHLYRVTEAGVRYFRCACGYQVPQVRRSPAEQDRARALLRGTRGAAATAGEGGGGSAPRADRS